MSAITGREQDNEPSGTSCSRLNGNNGEHHIVPTPSEYRAKIEARRVVARRVFDALCAQYPDKYVALIQPRDVLGDPRDDLQNPVTTSTLPS
jgi:hypothetical protein